MSMNESQKRQKAEAMANAEAHARSSTADGSPGRDDSFMARLKDLPKVIAGDSEATERMVARDRKDNEGVYNLGRNKS